MRIWGGQRSRALVVGLAYTAFVVCCVLPLGYLLATAAGSITALSGVALDPRQRALLFNTTILGAGTAGVATAVGLPLGIVLARVPLRLKGFIRLLAAAPVLLPPYIAGLSWVSVGPDLVGEWTYSLPAAILVLSLVLYPLSMLATEAALRRIDGRLEEAALTVAPPLRVLWRITIPLVAPSVAAAALIIFVLAASEFGLPGLLRVRVYTMEVFTAFAALYDFGRAIALTLPLLLLSVAGAGFAAWLLGDRLVTTRRSVGASPLVFDEWRRPATIAVVVVVATSLVMPVLILVREATAVRSLAAVTAGSGEAIVNSLVLSAAGASVVVAVAVWLAYEQARATRIVRLGGQALLIVLFAVPTTIVGVGLIGLWNRTGLFGAPYGTNAMFVLVYLARFVPVAALILSAGVLTISVSQEEAAAVSGSGWLRTMRGIVLPQLRVGIAGAWVVAFVLAFGELGASILIAPPGEATLPIRVYTIIANTPPSEVATLALLQSLIIFLPLAGFGAYVAVREAR